MVRKSVFVTLWSRILDTKDGQKLEIIDMIAYPDKAEANMKFGVRFFNTLRNLTCTGFFTTEMGIKDMDI